MAPLVLRVLLGCALAATAGASCGSAQWKQAYSPERCQMQDQIATVSCVGKKGTQCGTRMEATSRVGPGLHSMAVKAAPGSGVVTTFYLSNNGGMYDKSCTHPWVELDFEIMGHEAGETSRIWTNMLRDVCEENWQWITVPFDVSADFHTYGFDFSEDKLSFVVDGVAYRTIDTSHYGDLRATVDSSSFQEFISVWGRGSGDSGEGILEFREGLGLLDNNRNHFPLTAGYRRPSGPGALGVELATALTSSGEGQCADGPSFGADCRDSGCCAEGTCYEKDQHYAQCRTECAPGIHSEDAPDYRTPWSCHVPSSGARRLGSSASLFV